MRVHRRLLSAAASRDLLQVCDGRIVRQPTCYCQLTVMYLAEQLCGVPMQTAADALLAYAFGRDEDGALPGTMADLVAVRVDCNIVPRAPRAAELPCLTAHHAKAQASDSKLCYDYGSCRWMCE